MPKNWKHIKKMLEKEFLCEKLRGHITYDLTLYSPTEWYQQHFIMKFDDEVLLDASQVECQWDKRFSYPPHSPYYLGLNIADKYADKYGDDVSKDALNRLCQDVVNDTFIFISHHDGIYGVKEIIDAIGIYLHSDIKDSLNSPDPFINALAVLDRRCGKRTLQTLMEQRFTKTPAWLERIQKIRFEAEGIKRKL